MATNSEILLVQWLSARPLLAGVPVSTDVPADRPKRFITIERTGGSRSERRDLPMLAVQVWAESRVQAGDLAGMVADEIEHVTEHSQVGRVSLSGPYNFPDPSSGQARYQITVELVVVDTGRQSII